MTVVGKILIFLNLVFSLVVGAFAVMDYAARTQWVDAYDKLKKQYDDVNRKQAEAGGQIAELNAQRNALYKELASAGLKEGDTKDVGKQAVAMLNEQATQITRLTGDVTSLRDRLGAEQKRNAAFQASEKQYKTDMTIRQNDSASLRDTLNAEIKKNFEVTREMTNLRDQMVQAQIRARTLEDHNKRLVTRVTELEKLKNSAGIAKGVNAPPENVEGLVRRADGNLVTISLGSDAGLARNQTMEVFRLGQQAKYIGRIQIVDVTANSAVGRVSGRLSSPIQVGDRVASKIVGNN